MHGTRGFDHGDEEQSEFAEPESTGRPKIRGRGGTAPSSGRRDKPPRELEAMFHWLRSVIATDAQRRDEAVLGTVYGLGKRLDEVARNVELLLDALRDQGVRDAIDKGRATSDIHRRHLDLAQDYRRLVHQDLRILVRLLCPKQDGEGDMELARRRAEVVAELVVMLFQPLDRPVSVEPRQMLSELRELGPATDAAQFRGQFDAVFRKAAELRDTVAGLPFTAHLDFAVNLAALPTDHYQAWNHEQTRGARPEFLVAPAYVVAGDRPQSLTQPIVFVSPAVRP